MCVCESVCVLVYSIKKSRGKQVVVQGPCAPTTTLQLRQPNQPISAVCDNSCKPSEASQPPQHSTEKRSSEAR